MKTIADKFWRGNIEQQIINHFKKRYPHFQFEQGTRKVPLYPKIVLYTNVASAGKFLEQILPAFKIQKPQPSNESDQAFTRRIASGLVYPQQQGKITHGVILQGFPFNTSQALMLDRFLNGVNLAIHITDGQRGQQYDSLLKYYDERGTLLEIKHNENPSAEDLDNVGRQIVGAIKLTEF